MQDMQEVIIGYQGEMSLKGLNRNQFESATIKILRYRVKDAGRFRIWCAQSTFYIEPEDAEADLDLAFARVSKVFGLAAVSRSAVCEKDFDAICQTAESYLGAALARARTFKVEARRADKTFPMDSPALMRELGAYLLERHPRLKVDVHDPDCKVIVEIRDRGAYVHGPKVPGEGGLPVGTSGRALNMLSGGIDSPVAGYMIAKRGVVLDAVYFHAPPYTSERAKQKVVDLANLVARYAGPINLFVVNFTDIQLCIYENCPHEELTIIMRRYMMRIAQELAKRTGAMGLITGESIGQVASQTMQSLAATNDVCTMPVFRPVIGFDKQEIIDLSEKIGTYETSIQPYEDCCTIFVAKHPVTRPNINVIRCSELRLGEQIDGLMEEALNTTERILCEG